MDLSRSILIANLYRHGLNATSAAWVREHFPPDCGRVFGVEWPRVDLLAYRNRVIRDIALRQPPGIEWLLSIDNDVTITTPGMEHFLALAADVASCDCRMPPGTDPWCRPHSFHTTCWFARIDVFRRIPAPWFSFRYSADGCEMLACECQVFAEKVQAAGFTIAHGGWCGHGCEGKWCG